MKPSTRKKADLDRRSFIGGSDARIIMGKDESSVVRIWREKRGEVEPEDLSDNLIVQLGTVTEDLNRRWYERNTGHAVKHVQRRIQHPVIKWMAAMGGRSRRGQNRSQVRGPGLSRRRRPSRSIWPSSSTTCGSPTLGPPSCPSSRGRKMGQAHRAS